MAFQPIADRSLPTALKVVGALFLIAGFWALFGMILSLLPGHARHVRLDFNVICIAVGQGLLRLRPGWRTCALVILWVGFVALPVHGLFLLAESRDTPPIGGLLLDACYFALVLWQYCVLTRPDVRRLFGVADRRTGGPTHSRRWIDPV
ncbi:hypothetical protein LzC2_40590 [Planctomycetes bacterium LzC2]|uniref:Transmembrane protein n=1 Tax=Alienimonas chondri TaxID=2681879 RepID=A0ABX1VJ42_9PLAN|nr:hypothetical protein [Alienimonas chondri]